jgi:hypothetical protein
VLNGGVVIHRHNHHHHRRENTVTTTTEPICGPCARGSIQAYYDAWVIPPPYDTDDGFRYELTKNRARDSFCEKHAREFFGLEDGEV